MTGSDGKVADLTIEILREIRDEGRKTNQRLDSLREEMTDRLDSLRGEMTTRIDGLQQATREGFTFLGERIDNILLGEHREEHKQLRDRVTRLEERVGIGG